MQLYVELGGHTANHVSGSNILAELLSVYFKSYDSDYGDLKDMLGIDPLSVRVLPAGTLKAYRERYGEPIRKINCDKSDEVCLLRLVDELGEEAVK